MVFNATLNNISIISLCSFIGGELSTIFQLYRGGQFYLWKNFSTLFQLYRGSQSYWWRKPHNISVISWWSATIFQLYRGGQFLLVEETGLNNISAISWRSDLLVEETRVNTISVISWRSVLLVEGNRRTRRKPPTCRKSLTNFITYIVSSTLRHVRGSNSQL